MNNSFIVLNGIVQWRVQFWLQWNICGNSQVSTDFVASTSQFIITNEGTVFWALNVFFLYICTPQFCVYFLIIIRFNPYLNARDTEDFSVKYHCPSKTSGTPLHYSYELITTPTFWYILYLCCAWVLTNSFLYQRASVEFQSLK